MSDPAHIAGNMVKAVGVPLAMGKKIDAKQAAAVGGVLVGAGLVEEGVRRGLRAARSKAAEQKRVQALPAEKVDDLRVARGAALGKLDKLDGAIESAQQRKPKPKPKRTAAEIAKQVQESTSRAHAMVLVSEMPDVALGKWEMGDRRRVLRQQRRAAKKAIADTVAMRSSSRKPADEDENASQAWEQSARVRDEIVSLLRRTNREFKSVIME